MSVNLYLPLTDWKARLSGGFDTAHFRLRRFEEADRSWIHTLLAPRRTYTFIDDLKNHAQGKDWFDHVLGKRNHFFLTMKSKADGKPAGLFMFHFQGDSSLKLGGIVLDSLRNRGLASEFLAGLKFFLEANDFPYRITADVHVNHSQARHILEKTGWKKVGRSSSGNTLIYMGY